MNSDYQSFIIILTITASLILITDRIKAEELEETIFGCTGELLERNVGSRKFQKIQHNLNDIKIPERFDAREKWSYCKSLHHIKSQGKCGGCWAFSTSSVMSDRLCIATQGKFNNNLSEQDLMECCHNCVAQGREGGCKGGYSFDAFVYWKENGVVTGDEGCKPKEKGIVKRIAQKECRPKCTNESYEVEYKKDKTFSVATLMTYPVQKTDIKHIMAEIMLNGPIYGGITFVNLIRKVPPDGILKFDKSLIKKRKAGGGHAIKIVGWDNINGTPVWIMANSWGKKWCNKGFCYIRRGYDDFGIERRFIVGIPKIKTLMKRQKKIEKSESSGFNIIKITNPIYVSVILCILTM